MRKLRAFIVEDNPVILEGLSEALAEMADVETVGSAATQDEARAWFKDGQHSCDLVIIDVYLRSGSGIGVLEDLAGIAIPALKVVLTNYVSVEVRSRCQALGADGLFDKSTEIEELFEWLRRIAPKTKVADG